MATCLVQFTETHHAVGVNDKQGAFRDTCLFIQNSEVVRDGAVRPEIGQ